MKSNSLDSLQKLILAMCCFIGCMGKQKISCAGCRAPLTSQFLYSTKYATDAKHVVLTVAKIKEAKGNKSLIWGTPSLTSTVGLLQGHALLFVPKSTTLHHATGRANVSSSQCCMKLISYRREIIGNNASSKKRVRLSLIVQGISSS